MQRKLREERARLTRLRARLLVVRRALAARLVELYKADAPDAITVVLESEGFADLLTRTEFMERVSRQDARIMDIVADAKADATATAKRLDTLEKRQAQGRQADRGPARRGLHDPRRPRRPPRPHPDRPLDKTALLASSRDRRHELEDDVAALQPQQAKIQAKLAGFSGPVTAGPIKPGSGGLIWPVNGPITSPFCESRSWESCHPGIDIGVPAGTPIRAAALRQGRADAGRRRPPAATATSPASSTAASLSTCYAHQSRFGTSLGAQRQPGPGDRLRWVHRPLLRGPSPFRDPDQRRPS